MFTRRRRYLDLPMKMRRRQSDAKWRANVASCYETLKKIIPENKRATKRQISKALVLQETSKHVNFLEDILQTLLTEKAKTEDELDEEMAAELVQARLEEIEDDFVMKQRLKLEKHNRRLKAARHYCSELDCCLSSPVVSEFTLPFAQEVEISQASSTTEIEDLVKTLNSQKKSERIQKKPLHVDLEKQLAKATTKRRNQLAFAINNYTTLIRRSLHNAEHLKQQHERLFPNKTPRLKQPTSKMVTRSVPTKLHPVSSSQMNGTDSALITSSSRRVKNQPSKCCRKLDLNDHGRGENGFEHAEVPTIKEIVNEMVRASNRAREHSKCPSNFIVPTYNRRNEGVTPNKPELSNHAESESKEASHQEGQEGAKQSPCHQNRRNVQCVPSQATLVNQASQKNKNETDIKNEAKISPQVKVFTSKQVPTVTSSSCNMSTHFNCIKKTLPKISLIFVPKKISSNQRSILLRPGPGTTKIIYMYISQGRKLQNVQVKATTVPVKRPQPLNPGLRPRQPVARRQLRFTKGGREAHVTTNLTKEAENVVSVSSKTNPTLISQASRAGTDEGSQFGFTKIQIPPSPLEDTESDQAVPQIQKCNLTVDDLKLLCHEEIPSTDSDGSDLAPEDPLEEIQPQRDYERSPYHSTPGRFDSRYSSYQSTPGSIDKCRFTENKAFTDPRQQGKTKVHKPECCRSLFGSPIMDTVSVKSESEEHQEDLKRLSQLRKEHVPIPSEAASKTVYNMWCRLTPEQHNVISHMAHMKHTTNSSQRQDLPDDPKAIATIPLAPLHPYGGKPISKVQYGPPYNPRSLVGQPMVQLEPEDDLGVVPLGQEVVSEPMSQQVVPEISGNHSQVSQTAGSDAYSPLFGTVIKPSDILNIVEVDVAEATV